MPHLEPNIVETLKQHIVVEARKAGWDVQHVSAPSITTSEQKSAGPRPHVDVIIAGMHPILVADLGSSLDTATSVWAASQRQAAMVRTTIAADKGEDLILVLVGPPGSRDDGDWKALAMEIERNDLVCRKLVWLPEKKQPFAPESLHEFTRRTFIAKPWLATSFAQPQALDRLATNDLGLRGWQEILDEQPLDRGAVDYDELVKRLIEAEQP
jgi:hypothetical protein